MSMHDTFVVDKNGLVTMRARQFNGLYHAELFALNLC